ncbi:MAG: L-threonylcarbamoyladenylate synthase [Candidatus Hodarchaeales archaeon]
MVKTRIIDVNDPAIIEEFRKVIESKGVVVFPTDTCYGLAANAFSSQSIKKIYLLKKRKLSSPLSVTLSTDNLHHYADLSMFPENKLPDNIPTPITLVLNPLVSFPPMLMNENKVGFRIGNHKQINKLLDLTELVITATSANISGFPEPYSVIEVLNGIGGNEIDMIIDGGELPANNSVSAVVDLTGPQPVIIRDGKAVAELFDLLEEMRSNFIF